MTGVRSEPDLLEILHFNCRWLPAVSLPACWEAFPSQPCNFRAAGVGRNKSLVQVSPLSSPQDFSLGLPVPCWAGFLCHPASLL